MTVPAAEAGETVTWTVAERSPCVLADRRPSAPPARPYRRDRLTRPACAAWRRYPALRQPQWIAPVPLRLINGEPMGLHYQRVISPGTSTVVGDMKVTSVTGQLIPDSLLSVTIDGCSASAVIDAKHRFGLQGSVVVSERSKYLWGIRNHSSLDQHAVEQVVLVAPMGGASAAIPNLGRIVTIHGSPNGPASARVGS